jgi:hypothetical protein
MVSGWWIVPFSIIGAALWYPIVMALLALWTG